MAILLTNHGWHWFPSVLAVPAHRRRDRRLPSACWSPRLGIPSFVVTLAAFLGLQGVMLLLIGEGGTIGYPRRVVLTINNDNLPVWLGLDALRVRHGGLRGDTSCSTRRAAAGRAHERADAAVGAQDRLAWR